MEREKRRRRRRKTTRAPPYRHNAHWDSDEARNLFASAYVVVELYWMRFGR
jgi:hypothetical protein